MSWNDSVNTNNDVVRFGTPIWDEIWCVRMATKDTMSDDYLRHYGLPTTGDLSRDKAIRDERVKIYITIDAMVEHFRRGTTVEFVHNADVEAIYDIVYNYLGAWTRQLQRGLNVGGAPIEDLHLLDRFAQALFDQSRQFNGRRERTDFTFLETLMQGKPLINKLDALGLGSDGQAKQPEQAEQHRNFRELLSVMTFQGTTKAPDPTHLPGNDRWN